jgi:hypothetical protein
MLCSWSRCNRVCSRLCRLLQVAPAPAGSAIASQCPASARVLWSSKAVSLQVPIFSWIPYSSSATTTTTTTTTTLPARDSCFDFCPNQLTIPIQSTLHSERGGPRTSSNPKPFNPKPFNPKPETADQGRQARESNPRYTQRLRGGRGMLFVVCLAAAGEGSPGISGCRFLDS